MTIKNRIIYSSILLFALFLIMVGVNWAGNRAVADKNTEAYLLEKAIMHVQGIFRGVNEFIIDEGEPLSIELTHKHVNGYDEIHTNLVKSIDDPALTDIINNKITPQWETVKEGVLSFLKDNPYISVEDDKAMLEYGMLTTEARKLHEEVETLAVKTKGIAEDAAKKTKNIVNSVAGTILVITAFLLFNLYRSITKPIQELNTIVKGFGNGDLSLLMNESRKDEFGILASHLNRATAKLSEMISTVKNTIDVLSTNSEELSNAAVYIADNSKEQSTQTTQAASAIEELTASFMNVASNTAEAASSAKEAMGLAFESADVITGTVTSMNNISRSAHESSGTIEALNKGSAEISEIVKVIEDIAGQTNLLALNAAIEAARAGEQGRGFAVVADEVRKLAEKTTSSTSEIGNMISNIQANTAKTIESLKSWTGEVEAGLALAGQAGNALQSIVMSVNNVTDMVHQVATSADEQSATANVISSNVESIANLTRNTAESAEHSSDSTQALSDLARNLQNLVSGFTLRSDEAGNNPQEKGNSRGEVSGAMEAVES